MNKNNSNSKNRELAYNGIGSGGGGGGSTAFKKYEYVGDGAAERNIPKNIGINCILGVSATNINADAIALNCNIIPDKTVMSNILYRIGSNVNSTGFFVKYDDDNIIFYAGADAGARLNYDGGHYTLYYI